MKHYFILAAASMAFFLHGYSQYGHQRFANRHLSNLSKHTAVNVSLLPQSTNQINLGSAYKNWKDFYLTGDVYKGSNRFLSSDASGGTFLGNWAGKNTTGAFNTAIGDGALYNNTTGSENTATGYQALFNNTEGIWNAAYGYHALFSNTEGGNAAFGNQALEYNTTGYFNNAIGSWALWNNTTGAWNQAHGVGALAYNTEGSGNVGMGDFVLGFNTTGNDNAAVGNGAMWTNTTNSFNTAIGSEAAGNSLDYSNATFLGAYTNSDSGLINITAIGYDARAIASNQVMVGNSSVTSIGGYANWSNFSDGRYKKNVKEDVPGLEFITQLRPVTYTLDLDGIETKKGMSLQRKNTINIPGLTDKASTPNALSARESKQSTQELKAKEEKTKVIYTGFIAQEVEQAAKKLNYDFSGVDAPKSEKSFYALRYGDFVVPLVKAVQEQQKQIEEQQKQIEELKVLVQSLTKQGVSNTTAFSSSPALLKQNSPNPFNKGTVISYSIPDNATNAQIIVTDMKGSLIKTFTAIKGVGQINISSAELPAATYNYTLLVNGKKMDTRQMIITK